MRFSALLGTEIAVMARIFAASSPAELYTAGRSRTRIVVAFAALRQRVVDAFFVVSSRPAADGLQNRHHRYSLFRQRQNADNARLPLATKNIKAVFQRTADLFFQFGLIHRRHLLT